MIVENIESLKLNLRMILKNHTRANRHRRDKKPIRFYVHDISQQSIIKSSLEKLKMDLPQFKKELQKYDFVQLSDDEKQIEYKPKYSEIINWDSLVEYLKDPGKRLQGLQLEKGIELDTYWEILDDCKKYISRDQCPIRQIEIKGTDKRVLYYMGEKRASPLSKGQFLSRCDKIISTSVKLVQTVGHERNGKKMVSENRENEWVQGWTELRENYYKEMDIKK